MVQLRIYSSLLIGLMLIVGFSACKEYKTEEITDWEQLGDFPGTARASAVSFVAGDKAYVCLGRSSWNGDHLKDLWEYDSKTDIWTQKTDFPGHARVNAVGVAIGTKAYVGMGAIGAYDTSNLFSDFWEYDTETDTWTEKAPFPGPGKNDMTYAVMEGKLYTTMGFDGTSKINDTWVYNPLDDTWSSLAQFPKLYLSSTGFSIGNGFYAGTGFNGFNEKKFFRYKTDADKWTRISDLPEGRMLSSGLSIGDKGYVLLGRYWNGYLNGGRLLSDIVEYDPASDTWTKRGDFPGGARQNSVVFSINGKGYVVMGEDDNERKSDVWCFKP